MGKPIVTQTCSDLLYRITAKNMTQNNLRIKLGFVVKDGLDVPDLIYPQGGIKDYLLPEVETPLLTLRRKNPYMLTTVPEMSKLNITLTWKAYKSTDFTICNYASQTDKPSKQKLEVITKSSSVPDSDAVRD